VCIRPTKFDLRCSKTLQLKFCGEGKSYELRLRAICLFGCVHNEAVPYTGGGVWQERVYAIDEFIPVWRGRRPRY
jgi:hypothetical protein